MTKIRIGQGIDFHKFKEGLDLWIGGVKIPWNKGCIAHSDGDVLLHAICDAMLGAAGLNDIGHYFPDSSPEFENIRSTDLLKRTYLIIREKGYHLVNIDSTVCLEKPKIAALIPGMKEIIAGIIETTTESVSIKATTTEKMGFTGREEGIVALASVLLEEA